MEPVEEQEFYQCIQGLILIQRLGGGNIQRAKSDQTGLFKYYTFKTYCILCHSLTLGMLLRILFFFIGGVSVDVESIYAYLAMSLFIANCVAQIVSFYAYTQILPFWDSLLAAIPWRFDIDLFRPMIGIRFITSLGVCYVIVLYASSFYFIIQPELDPAYIRIAEPWTDTLTEVRISIIASLIGILPAFISWNSTATFFITAGYYLRAGFMDLYKAMDDDTAMVQRLSTYKIQHLRLSKLTGNLDYILRGMIGASLFMATFDMCFVIFTLSSSNSIFVLVGSIGMLCMAVTIIVIVAVLSISINSWVSALIYMLHIFRLYFFV